MRGISILCAVAGFNVVPGCGTGARGAPDAAGISDAAFDAAGDTASGATTITINAGVAPALVAFRDGLTAAWQPATMKTPTTFEAEVHGPYLVTVVCTAFILGDLTTMQVARMLGDGTHVELPCGQALPTRLSGQMVQAGSVAVGHAAESSPDPDWRYRPFIAAAVPDRR